MVCVSLTQVFYVEVCGVSPGAVSCQRGGSDPHGIIPRMHHSQLAAPRLLVHLPGHTVVQLLEQTHTLFSFICVVRGEELEGTGEGLNKPLKIYIFC